MRFDQSSGHVYIRQSWLNDLAICPERARFKLEKPEMSSASDATIMGTAVHYGIECVLGGICLPDDMATNALNKWEELKQEPYRITNLDPDKSQVQIISMCEAWKDDILPFVQLGGEIEMKFRFPLNATIGDWSVWCEGTMDYVQPNGIVWDWKTASRTYYAKEKQSQAIQPTVYAAALNHLGLSDYPVEFRYGVMVRQEKPKAQIVSIHRTEAHERWLMHNIKPAVVNAVRVGINNNWLMNDTSALCSEKWCDYWSLCKGAFLSPFDMSLPIQSVAVDIQSTGE